MAMGGGSLNHRQVQENISSNPIENHRQMENKKSKMQKMEIRKGHFHSISIPLITVCCKLPYGEEERFQSAALKSMVHHNQATDEL